MLITGLKLWLKADTGTYTTQAMTTPQTSDAGAVGGWADQSGQGNHFVEIAAGNNPTLKLNIQGGRPVIRFAGTGTPQRLMTAAVNTIPKQAPFTLFFVVKTDLITPSSNRIMAGKSGSNKAWQIGQSVTTNLGTIKFTKAGVADVAGLMPNFSTDKFEIITAVFDAAYDFSYYINGGMRDFIATTTDCVGGNVEFVVGGNNADGQSWDGDIAEAIVYTGVLTSAQITAVNNYLAKKYVITKSPVLNSPSTLTIPDYPGLGKVVHPDVLYFAAGWNGYKYWMAYTPYPPEANENPSLAVSNDGVTWITPPGLTNPVIAAPTAPAYNSDASLCMSADGLTMWLIWRKFEVVANYDRVYVASSTDGITWGASTLIIDTSYPYAMSPSALWDGAQFVMYTCTLETLTYHIERRVCATMDGTWGAVTDITFANSSQMQPKHADIILSGGVYYLIFMDSVVAHGVNRGLYFAKGSNGIAFTLDPNFRMAYGVGVWDYEPYRASLLPVGDGMDIYYSGFDVAGTTAKIGKTHYTLP